MPQSNNDLKSKDSLAQFLLKVSITILLNLIQEKKLTFDPALGLALVKNRFLLIALVLDNLNKLNNDNLADLVTLDNETKLAAVSALVVTVVVVESAKSLSLPDAGTLPLRFMGSGCVRRMSARVRTRPCCSSERGGGGVGRASLKR